MATIKELEYYLSQARRIAEHREREAELGIRKTYKTVLEDIRSFLGNEYAKNAKDDKLTYADLQKKGQFARFLEGVEKIVNEGTPEVSKQIKSTVNEVYKACYDGMVNAVKKSSTTKELHDQLKGLKNTTPETIKRAVENPITGLTLDDTLEKNRKEVIYDIKREIGVGLANGDRYTTMAKRLTERVDMDYRKAVTIARTETHRVKEAGFHDSATDINKTLDKGTTTKRLQKKWVSMRDERVRKTSKANHRKMDGVSIPVEDKFDLGRGVKAESPGNSGDAANDIHCRCFLRYELVEVAEKAKKMQVAEKTESNKSNVVAGVDINTPQTKAFSDKFQEIIPDLSNRIKSSNLPSRKEQRELYKDVVTSTDEMLMEFVAQLESNVLSYRGISEQSKKEYAEIFSVIAKPHDGSLYRGESGTGVERFGEFTVGKTISFDTFGFTSPSKKTPEAHTGVVFEFETGTPSINFVGQDDIDDDELILGEFEIVDVTENDKGVPYVKLKYKK